MIHEWLMCKDLEGSSRDLIDVSSWNLPEEAGENLGVAVENRTEYLPNSYCLVGKECCSSRKKWSDGIETQLFLFCCCLFNDAGSNAVHTATNDLMS